MEHQKYIARRRARFRDMGGRDVNIPYGTELEAKGGVLYWEDKPLCFAQSQNARDYFSQDDDGCGEERGKLVTEILNLLAKQDAKHQARWDKVWEDAACQRMRNPEHEDFWVWTIDFYEATTFDLWHIKRLIQV